MILIENLGTERVQNGKMRRFGMFYCEHCKKIVKRLYRKDIKQKSCGCIHYELTGLAKRTHGDSNSRLYIIWQNMKNRCYNEKHISYKNYGARNIHICDEWINSYINFREWALNNGYKSNLTIERKNNDKGYNPENCTWITNSENNRHRRNMKLNWNKVKLIRHLFKSDYSKVEIMNKFDISIRHLNRILKNERWTDNNYTIT